MSQPCLADRTGQVRLRPWRPADAAAVLAAFTDPAVRRWSAFLVDTPAQAADFVDVRTRQWAERTGAAWCIADAASDAVLGHVGFRVVDSALQVGAVGYWVRPGARGRRLAARALLLATPTAMAVLGWRRCELYHDVANPASCAAAVRAGYSLEGTLRQAMRYPVDGRWTDEHLHARLATDPDPGLD